MLTALASFIADIFSLLSPEMALAGGIPLPPRTPEKPTLATFFGGGGNSSAGSNLSAPPVAPQIILPPIPKAPTPPPPPSMASTDVAAAAQQGAAQQASGFGYKASLLRVPSAALGPNGTTNSATGGGSLLGKA